MRTERFKNAGRRAYATVLGSVRAPAEAGALPFVVLPPMVFVAPTLGAGADHSADRPPLSGGMRELVMRPTSYSSTI
jgi:hypothetical protein